MLFVVTAQKKMPLRDARGIQVPGAGVEPARPCERQILSLVRLPISPSRQISEADCNPVGGAGQAGLSPRAIYSRIRMPASQL
jgi:hypothetical protein